MHRPAPIEPRPPEPAQAPSPTALPTAGLEPAVDPWWFKDAVVYQLHVKSFFDGNDDGVGDFTGLIDKLDYIADLGVDTLWLLPFYPSPRRDDGYDIAAYMDVHPDYGTLDDARRFIDAAHARGLRVVTELVINHTSDEHPWFQRARRAPRGSPEHEFYVWSDTDQAYAGTRIVFCDVEKSNWTWDPVAERYYWHRFFSHQPDLNFDNPLVLDAVIGVMRFWLDIGVDGFRLDAVPYLVEREGTSNEGLPETHAILKRIRAAMDAQHPGRMLLAEANAWPEDSQQYFGDGDECHMAFHFALMPRMYMAIAREDRFPISDILRQTPELPPGCQWAIFLRNHDELTLEMVTDAERDYLWNTYAADRRARLYLGIRRRLAPLLERDRRRIELMYGLLLTMPGTPVLYYGDEIGMGDNIHLGDRDGVRTPMQWSIDRNGGFSRADTASLVLPTIMDPLYGFPAVNVEAQQRDPHSLLHWTRRMLGVRRRYRAFGRGSMRLLYPRNRKILAYLRLFGDEIVLCVANLSRSLQPVELDLSEFEGRVPVEAVGGSALPALTRASCMLTLPPYGFHLFELARRDQLPEWHVPEPEPLPEFQTLVLRGDLADELRGLQRERIERDLLPPWLARRRWFAQAAAAPPHVHCGRVFAVDGDPDIAVLEVAAEDDPVRYLLPLGLAFEGGNDPPLAVALAMARARRGRRVGHLTDAHAVRALAHAVLRAFASPREPADAGALRCLAEPGTDIAALTADAALHWATTDQPTSVLVVDGTLALKLFRRVQPGEHPDAALLRHLAAVGCPLAPALLGEAVVDDGASRTTVALLQRWTPNQDDAWQWTVDHLRRTVDEYRSGDPALQQELLAAYDRFAEHVGRRLADLHAALAQPGDDAAFAPRPIDAALLQQWIDEAELELAAAAELLDAPTTAALRRAAAPAFDAVRTLGACGLATRVHGDLHLGRMWIVVDEIGLIDVGDEHDRVFDARTRLRSPLYDVAAVLQSLQHAIAAVAHGTDGSDHGGTDYLDAFRSRASATLLAAYRAAATQAQTPWIAAHAFDPLLRMLQIQRAAYELRHETPHRPLRMDAGLEILRGVLGGSA